MSNETNERIDSFISEVTEEIEDLCDDRDLDKDDIIGALEEALDEIAIRIHCLEQEDD